MKISVAPIRKSIQFFKRRWRLRCYAAVVVATALSLWAAPIDGRVVSDYPGTPTTNWANPDAGLVIVMGRGTGAQPVSAATGPVPVLAGDVVMLNDPAGGDTYTNWRAVVSVFNPADPTGTKGLDATESESYFSTNRDIQYFSNFTLLPRTVFAPAQSTNSDGSIYASFVELGPNQGIAAGQTITLDFVAPVPFVEPPYNAANPPILSISFPIEGEVLTNQTLSALGSTGTASNAASMSAVWVRCNDGAWTTSETFDNLTNWVSDVLVLNPGTNTVQAYAVDKAGRVSETNTVTFMYIVTAGGIFAGPPGTPADGFKNPGGTRVAIGEGGGIGVQPISSFSGTFNAFAGDVVMLLSNNGGDSPTNWEAAIHFFNPLDPTGTIGLEATEYETFFSSEKELEEFSGLQLLPNTVYLPINATNADGSITAIASAFGPVGSLYGGQQALMIYSALPQPEPFSVALGASLALQLTNGVPVEIHGAIPGSTYEFQYSSNLVTWIAATPSVVAVTNTISWTDSGLTGSTNQPWARFYRAALLP